MNWIRIITIVACLSGCTYQVVDISFRYFKYTTNPKVKVSIVFSTPLPSVSVCWRLYDVMKQKLLNYGHVPPANWREFNQLLRKLTVADIFKFSSDNDTIFRPMGACAFRKKGYLTYRIPWYNQTECNEMFTITMYIHRLGMCYKIMPRSQEWYDFRETTLTPSQPGKMYMFHFNPDAMNNVSVNSIYIHTSKSSPLFDSIFTSDSLVSVAGSAIVDYTPYSVHKLPSPHETKCRDIPGYRTGEEYFLRLLNNASMEAMKYVHTLEHVYEPYKYPIFDSDTLRHPIIGPKFLDLNSRNKQHDFVSCWFEYTVPKIVFNALNRVLVHVNWPQDPGIAIFTVADYAVIDYLIYICSSIGIWLGLSAYSILDLIGHSVANHRTDHGVNGKERKTNVNMIPKNRERIVRRLEAQVCRQEMDIQSLRMTYKRQDNLIVYLLKRRNHRSQ